MYCNGYRVSRPRESECHEPHSRNRAKGLYAPSMRLNILLVVLSLILFFWLLAFPISAWVIVHVGYPHRLRRMPGEPDFPVNVIVPCKGSNAYLEENLRAFASQDYPGYVATFVTNAPEDEANEVIASVPGGTRT